MRKKDKTKLRQDFLEELYRDHNVGWARNILNINIDNLDKPAIFYRGNTITYRRMFAEAFKYAEALKNMGVKMGMEIPMCLSHTPEEVYIVLAASFIGAKINIFGAEFDKDYIAEIINKTDAKTLFVTDDKYAELINVIPNTNLEKVVMFSITDSYPNGKNPYAALEKRFYDGKNRVPKYQRLDDKILNVGEFTALASDFKGTLKVESEFEEYVELFNRKIEVPGLMSDIFSISYSSGSTNAHRPKAITHRVRSFNAMGMAHNGYDTPKMKDLRVHVQIPSHSNTGLISGISDTLSQGCCCALEYIYDEYFFPTSLLINKSNEVVATKSHWVRAFKEYETNPVYRNVKKLPFLFVPIAAGEATSPGEEKYFNKMLRKYKAGTNFIPTPVSAITMSMAGGDCEHGGIFFNIFKGLKEKDPRRTFRKHPKGYDTYRMVEVAVLDENGDYCKPYETGTLVANSPCTMVEYKDNVDATNAFFINSKDNKVWATCNTYGYLDIDGGIHIKGRIPDHKEEIPPYVIQDEILKDTKRIMSCEVVRLENGMYVAHIERQPGIDCPTQALIHSIEARLSKSLPTIVVDRIVYRVRSFDEGYPLTNCGKRSGAKLREENLKRTLKLVPIDLDRTTLMSGQAYSETLEKAKKLVMQKEA